MSISVESKSQFQAFNIFHISIIWIVSFGFMNQYVL